MTHVLVDKITCQTLSYLKHSQLPVSGTCYHHYNYLCQYPGDAGPESVTEESVVDGGHWISVLEDDP